RGGANERGVVSTNTRGPRGRAPATARADQVSESEREEQSCHVGCEQRASHEPATPVRTRLEIALRLFNAALLRCEALDVERSSLLERAHAPPRVRVRSPRSTATFERSLGSTSLGGQTRLKRPFDGRGLDLRVGGRASRSGFQSASRDSGDRLAWWNVVGYDGASSDERTSPDPNSTDDHRAGADRRVTLDHRL